jgi:hypothetical protein
MEGVNIDPPRAPVQGPDAGAIQTFLRGFTCTGWRGALGREEDLMFSLNDLFQWERFITPSIIKIFYWLAVGLTVLFGLSGVASAFGTMVMSPGVGIVMLLASLVGVVIGIIFARIAAEFILIVFRINEHLGAIRNRGEM